MDIYAIRLSNLKLLQGSLSRKELAAKLGMDYGQVGHWFMAEGREGRRNIGSAKAREIEAAFGKELGWLDRPHQAVAEPAASYELPFVPIVGFAIATPDEDGYFDDMGFPPGAGMGFIVWASRDPHAYALQVKRESMAPRIRPGEFIVVEPGAQPHVGDDVLVQLKNGRKMVKRLAAKTRATVSLASINQAHNDLHIEVADVQVIHKIGAFLPRSTPTLEPEALRGDHPGGDEL